jgi:hypothetical protein
VAAAAELPRWLPAWRTRVAIAVAFAGDDFAVSGRKALARVGPLVRKIINMSHVSLWREIHLEDRRR